MELAAILGVIWTLSVLTFLYSEYLAIPAYANPLSLIVIMALFMINPTKTFRYEARFWLLRIMARIFAAPFVHVGFADFWLADQLNSLGQAFVDLRYVVCFYTTPNATVNGEEFGNLFSFMCALLRAKIGILSAFKKLLLFLRLGFLNLCEQSTRIFDLLLT